MVLKTRSWQRERQACDVGHSPRLKGHCDQREAPTAQNGRRVFRAEGPSRRLPWALLQPLPVTQTPRKVIHSPLRARGVGDGDGICAVAGRGNAVCKGAGGAEAGARMTVAGTRAPGDTRRAGRDEGPRASPACSVRSFVSIPSGPTTLEPMWFY